MSDIPVLKSCEEDSEVMAAFQIMRQLRPHLEEIDFVDRVRRQKQSGYSLVAAYIEGEVAGVVGYRFVEDLAWARTIYVDDLVVDEGRRRQGVGETLMKYVERECERRKCDSLRLSSGLAREDAHRFYERLGMEKFSYAFIKKLN